MQKIKQFAAMVAASIALVGASLFGVVAVAHAGSGANIDANLCQGISLDADTVDTAGTAPNQDTCGEGGANDRVNNIIKTVINIFSLVVGVVSVIMIIIGGFKYITSGGESSNVTSAKNTILYAIIGLVVVALAQILVRFVFSRATSTGGP